jgi:hypothetical protein
MTTMNDGFSNYPADTGSGYLQGTTLRFLDWKWFAGRGNKEFDTARHLVVTGVTAVWVRWQGNRPTDHRDRTSAGIYPAREDLPDSDADRWECGVDGHPKDPWQDQRYVYLFDRDDASIFTFVTSSAGGRRAVATLRDQTLRMRSFRGPVYPVVKLGAEEMPTRFGRKSKPLFEIIDWVMQGASSTAPPVLPPPQTVEPVAIAEELSDEIPF